MLTDEEIAAMTPEERGALIRRLARPGDDLLPARWWLRRMREFWVLLLVGSVVFLVPWIVYLALTLPRVYIAQDWDRTWVGFDVLLLFLLVTTAVLGFLRRQLIVSTAFASGILILADAWFDVATAQGSDKPVSLVMALVVELPLAALLITGAMQIMRLTAARLWNLEHGTHAWQIRIPVPSVADSAVRRRRAEDARP